MQDMLQKVLAGFGIQPDAVSHREKLASALGGFIGILLVYLTGSHLVHDHQAALLAASIGATAVLLFGVPHSALSQPWPVIGGHVASACAGVAAVHLAPEPLLAAPLSVALAIAAMYYLRCLHPPGGGTALSAVVGGPAVHEMGYQYVLTPVLSNVLVILAAGLVVNSLMPGRRYPLRPKPPAVMPTPTGEGDEAKAAGISHEDLEYALKTMDSYIDIVEDDLLEIYRLARKHAEEPRLDPDQLKAGLCYSNGRFGREWEVRRIVEMTENLVPEGAVIVFKTLVGAGRGITAVCTPEEFLEWARYEVVRDESYWRKAA